MKPFSWLTSDEEKPKDQNPNTPEETKLLHEIIKNQENAESVRGTEYTNTTGTLAAGIEQIWEDEQKMLNGNQWDTSFAYRPKAIRKTRPNSVDNFIFPAIINIHANMTANTPEVSIEGTEENDNDIAEKLTYISRFNDSIYRNNFRSLWKKMALPFIAYGPIIGAVLWDPDWIGGSGPNRWIGDVRIINVDRRTIYFDPAIIDLEDRLQECSFINRKFRKKLLWIKNKWPEKGKAVAEDNNEMELQNEGQEPGQVWLIESTHRGKPKYITPKRAKELNAKGKEIEAEGDYYKAQDYYSMAKGELDGVHCAYVANGVFLEYVPYVYEDGLYPFVYKVCYYDENSPHGFGEIRNIKVPQVMHNKADEIEIEAMSREGLGGGYHNSGALTEKQKTELVKNSGKGGMWFEVDNINGMKEREGAKVPASVTNYKEHKQRMIETISQNTPIQQGMSPGANMPYKAIAELGARTDVKFKAKIEVLEDFLVELNKLRINRFMQFYTEDRYYRLKGNNGEIIQGTFNHKEAMRSWDREAGEEGKPRQEMFVPEFDIKVKIIDEKPTDRNYNTQTAFALFDKKAMSLKDLLYTLEEGKLPTTETILKNLESESTGMQIAEAMANLTPEMQQQIMQMIQQSPQQGQQTGQGGNIDAFLDSLPDEALQAIQQMPPEQQGQHIQAMMQMQPEQLQTHVQQMMGGMQGAVEKGQ